MRAPGWMITRSPISACEHGRAGADRAIASDRDARADHGAGRDQRAGADFGAGPDRPPADRWSRPPRSAPTDAHARPARVRWRRTARTAAAPRETVRAPPRRRRDKAPAVTSTAQRVRRRASKRGASRQTPACVDRPAASRYFALSRKRDVGRPRRVERRDVADAPVERTSAARLGARERDDLADRQLAVDWEEVRHAPALTRVAAAIRTAFRRRTGTIGCGRTAVSGSDRRNRTAADRTANPR